MCFAFGLPAAAQETNRSAGEWSIELATMNRYVWRGFVDGGRTFETDITYARGGWEVCASTDIGLTVEKGEDRTTEVDLYVTRRVELRPHWGAAFGYDYYSTPQAAEVHGHEFWTGLEYSGPVDFSLKAYQFAIPHSGNYFSAELGRKLLRRGRFSLQAETTLGFNRHMYIDDSGLSDATLTLTPAVRIGGGAIKPFITYAKGLKKEYFDNHFVFGIKFAVGGRE
jgi:hypothetical protein